MARSGDSVDRRPARVRASFAQQIDSSCQRCLLCEVEIAPPVLELVGELDFSHQANMSDYDLAVKTHVRHGASPVLERRGPTMGSSVRERIVGTVEVGVVGRDR